jgi:hypothetical protein
MHTRAQQIDKKQLLKRRRQIVVESDDQPNHRSRIVGNSVPSNISTDIYLHPIAGLPIPDSSGDEYSCQSEGDHSDENHAANDKELLAEFIDDGMFALILNLDTAMYDNSDGSSDVIGRGSRRRNRNRKRTRASVGIEDEDLIDEFEENQPKRSRRNVKMKAEKLDFDISEEEEEGAWETDLLPVSYHQSSTKPKARFTRRTEPAEWLTVSTYKFTPYLPQINDLVVYVKQGHKTFSALTSSVFKSTVKPELEETILCRIKSLTYTPGHVVKCLVELAMYSSMDDDADDNILTENFPVLSVTYFEVGNVADFLILWDDYKQGMSNEWRVGDSVIARFHDGEFEGVLDEIIDGETPWEKFRIKFSNSERSISTRPVSPWEIRPLEGNWAVLPTMKRKGSVDNLNLF